jgi:hypothetical protein
VLWIRCKATWASVKAGFAGSGLVRSAKVTSDRGAPPARVVPWQLSQLPTRKVCTSQGRPMLALPPWPPDPPRVEPPLAPPAPAAVPPAEEGMPPLEAAGTPPLEAEETLLPETEGTPPLEAATELALRARVVPPLEYQDEGGLGAGL